MPSIEYHVTECYAAGVYMTRRDAEHAAAEPWLDGRPGEGRIAEVDVSDDDYDLARAHGLRSGEWVTR